MPVRKRKPRAPWHQWATRIGWAVALALILAYTPYRFMGDNPGRRGAPELSVELAQTNDQIKVLERENARLRQEIHALRHDPEAIEDIARDELGFVRSSDLVIRIKGAE